MKIDRLIGILSILLQEEKTTAPELEERFEVSRRTINRDIENLTMWLLTFGDKVEVLEPMELREKLKTVAEAMIKMYEG